MISICANGSRVVVADFILVLAISLLRNVSPTVDVEVHIDTPLGR